MQDGPPSHREERKSKPLVDLTNLNISTRTISSRDEKPSSQRVEFKVDREEMSNVTKKERPSRYNGRVPQSIIIPGNEINIPALA